MRALFLLFAVLLVFATGARAVAGEPWTIQSDGSGLHTLEFDSTRTKSTIVEFSDAIYLLEVSLSDQGGGARTLTEHREGGESILRILDARFPDKPLAAVLHSHWHPHSISSVAPFLERDIPLVTTRANFERVREFVDPGLLEARGHLIRYVDGDTMTLGERDETIVVRRLLEEDYPSLPTPDYLFFEIPGRKTMHTGCMYSIWRGEPVAGREVVPRRASDLHAFISRENLELDGLMRVYLDSDEESPTEIIPAQRLYQTIETGITSAELVARFDPLTAVELREQRERLVREAIVDKVPASILNSLVYRALGEQDLDKARELALLQALLAPSSANAWDTLGEVYYFMGEMEVARAYEAQSRAIDPEFDGGGESVWEKNLAEHRERWTGGGQGS